MPHATAKMTLIKSDPHASRGIVIGKSFRSIGAFSLLAVKPSTTLADWRYSPLSAAACESPHTRYLPLSRIRRASLMVNNLDAASLGTCVTRLSLLSRHGQRAGDRSSTVRRLRRSHGLCLCRLGPLGQAREAIKRLEAEIPRPAGTAIQISYIDLRRKPINCKFLVCQGHSVAMTSGRVARRRVEITTLSKFLKSV
jgi:hypothetical protein